MPDSLDEDLEELLGRTTTGSHEIRNKAIGDAEVRNIQTLRNLTTKLGKLEKTIIKLNRLNGKLDNKVFWLTVVAVVLSAFQLIQVIDIVIRWLN